MRVAIYARVSTLEQEPENQLAELRRYAAARGRRTTAAGPLGRFARRS
jgi:DNA invertase Pin-like site-specific DNA recombinase